MPSDVSVHDKAARGGGTVFPLLTRLLSAEAIARARLLINAARGHTPGFRARVRREQSSSRWMDHARDSDSGEKTDAGRAAFQLAAARYLLARIVALCESAERKRRDSNFLGSRRASAQIREAMFDDDKRSLVKLAIMG